MNATPNKSIDQAMAKLEAIADRLQRGEITLEAADAESRLVRDALVREVKAGNNETASAGRRARMRTSLTPAREQTLSGRIFEPRGTSDAFPQLSAIWSTLVLLCCAIGGVVVLVRGINSK
jgi:hypothetical protein